VPEGAAGNLARARDGQTMEARGRSAAALECVTPSSTGSEAPNGSDSRELSPAGDGSILASPATSVGDLRRPSKLSETIPEDEELFLPESGQPGQVEQDEERLALSREAVTAAIDDPPGEGSCHGSEGSSVLDSLSKSERSREQAPRGWGEAVEERKDGGLLRQERRSSNSFDQVRHAISKTRRASTKLTRRISTEFDRIGDALNERTALYTLDPNSFEKQSWDWFIICLVVYNAVFIPIDLAFSETHFGSSMTYQLWVFDTIVDGLFACDIAASFRTQYADKHGDMVKDPKMLAKMYMAHWFWIDFLATIPFETLGELFVPSASSQAGALGLLKTIRLFRLGRLLKKLDQLAAANFLRIAKLMTGYVLCVHWCACGWFFLAKFEEDGSWLETHEVLEASMETQYGLCFNWALTTVLPGSGVVVPQNNRERAYSDVVMIMGALMNAFVFGNVAALIQSFDAIQGQYTKQVETIKAFSQHFDLDPKLRSRLLSYVDQSWSILGGFEVNRFVVTLPTGLRNDVYSHIYRQIISNEPMFEECNPGFVRMILARLAATICVEGECFIMEDDIAEEMFFLTKGSCIVAVKQKTVAVLKDKQPVGHIALLKNLGTYPRELNRRTASVQCSELCELSMLRLSDLEFCCRNYPDHAEKLRNFAFDDEIRLQASTTEFQNRDLQAQRENADARIRPSQLTYANAQDAAVPKSDSREFHLNTYGRGGERGSQYGGTPGNILGTGKRVSTANDGFGALMPGAIASGTI